MTQWKEYFLHGRDHFGRFRRVLLLDAICGILLFCILLTAFTRVEFYFSRCLAYTFAAHKVNG